jgi:undecaprenyl-diphosphatase
MITIASAFFLGIVEGFTEFLPVSSTAHLILASRLLQIDQSNFTKTFEIAIQSGAILAVFVLYYKKFFEIEALKKIIVAFIPTGILGLVFYKVVKSYLLGSIPVVLSSLAIGGFLLIIFEYLFVPRNAVSSVEEISYAKAASIGFFQSIAMIPGVSRSAATIVGGMLMGIRRETIVEFSFLLAVPTMLAATGLDLLKNIHEFGSADISILGVGFLVSFVMALLSIKFLLSYIRRHSFTSFGVYRIFLVAVFLLIIL